MRVLLTGGGTGGHLYPGLAVTDLLCARHDAELLFVGTATGVEARVVPARNIAFKTVWISGLHRGRILVNLLFPLKMAVSLVQCLCIIRRYDPDLVIGTGGFVTWPVVQAALILKKRTVLQEQNRAPGLVTKLLASRVDRVFVSFESSRNYLKRQDTIRVSGNPVRKEIISGDRQEAYRYFSLDPERPTVFIFGGSQGALGMNRLLVPVIQELLRGKKVQVLWAAGPRWANDVQNAFRHNEAKPVILPYIDRMDLAYAAADLLICRAGATTIAELTCAARPAVLIPFPGAANAHQAENGAALAEKGAGVLVHEKETDTQQLTRLVTDLLESPEKLEAMSSALKMIARPDAAEHIVREIESLIKGEYHAER